MNTKPANKNRKKFSARFSHGKIRLSQTNTSLGVLLSGQEIDESFRKDIPFKKYSKAKIKQVFTDQYVADLLARASENRKQSPAINPYENELIRRHA